MICAWDESGCFKLFQSLESVLVHSLIQETCDRLITFDNGLGPQKLKEYIKCWDRFSALSQRLPVAFQQLDKAAQQLKPRLQLQIERSHNQESAVRNLMLRLWDQYVFGSIGDSLQDIAILILSAERSGLIVDSFLILALRDSLVCLDKYNHMIHDLRNSVKQDSEKILRLKCYMNRFASIYIQELEAFYTAWALANRSEKSRLQYIKWALQKFNSEQSIAELYMGPNVETLRDKVSETCVKVLIEPFAEDMLVECPQYIRSNVIENENMKMLFAFLNIAGHPYIDSFFKYWKEHILSSSFDFREQAISTASNECEQQVEKLIESYNHFHSIINQSLFNDQRAKTILDRTFKAIINGNESRNASEMIEPQFSKLLAMYCDLLLMGGSRKLVSREVSERLDRSLLIIKFVKDLDTFIKFHKLYLTKRLLLKKTASIEVEEQFVQNLEKITDMPYESINKIKRMFKDLRFSENLQEQFKSSILAAHKEEKMENSFNNNNNIESVQKLPSSINKIRDLDSLDIKILNQDAWPRANEKNALGKSLTHLYPIESSYEIFYNEQFAGRKLEWCHHLSHGILTFTTANGKFDLVVSAAQHAILSAFNSNPDGVKNLADLELESSLSSCELRKTLWVSTTRSRPELLI